jgi:hypothetical protein
MSESDTRPDVESIIAEIQERVARSEGAAVADTDHNDPALEQELQSANRHAAAGQAGGFGERMMRRLLRSLVEDVNAYQAASVRCLNILAKRSDAASGEGLAELLQIARRTEAKQVELEKRIRSLEEQDGGSGNSP